MLRSRSRNRVRQRQQQQSIPFPKKSSADDGRQRWWPWMLVSGVVLLFIVAIFVYTTFTTRDTWLRMELYAEVVQTLSAPAAPAGAMTGFIPKHIWSYWEAPPKGDGAQQDAAVQACLSSWKRFCPDYEITVFNAETAKMYLPQTLTQDKVDSVQRYTDFLRLFVLVEHGGIWIDASMLLTAPLDWVHQSQQQRPGVELVACYMAGYTTRPEWPVVESWFLACTPQSQLMRHWRNEFCQLLKHESPGAYISDLTHNRNVDLQDLNFPTYLTIHASLQAVLQGQAAYEPGPPLSERLVAFKAEDGPFKLQVDNHWNSEKVAALLCGSGAQGALRSTDLQRLLLIKFRSTERTALAARGCNLQALLNSVMEA